MEKIRTSLFFFFLGGGGRGGREGGPIQASEILHVMKALQNKRLKHTLYIGRMSVRSKSRVLNQNGVSQA